MSAGLIYAGWQINVLQNDLIDTEYQLTLSHNETAHMHEAWDGLYEEYGDAKDTADFWADKYMQTDQLYLDCLNKPPIIITEYLEIEVPVEVIKEVVKPVSTPMTEWRDFKSKTEFYEWYDNLVVIWIDTGKAVDCDDWSEFVWDMAYNDGYRMSEPIIHQGQYCGRHVQDNNILHIGGQVQIGNSYYYFEPNPEFDRLIYLCDRD